MVGRLARRIAQSVILIAQLLLEVLLLLALLPFAILALSTPRTRRLWRRFETWAFDESDVEGDRDDGNSRTAINR